MVRFRHVVSSIFLLGAVQAPAASAASIGSSVCATVNADEAAATQCSSTPPFGQTFGATVSLEGRTVLPGNSNGDPIFGLNIGAATATATVDSAGLHLVATAVPTNPNASLAGPAPIGASAMASYTVPLSISVVLTSPFTAEYGLTAQNLPNGFHLGDVAPIGSVVADVLTFATHSPLTDVSIDANVNVHVDSGFDFHNTQNFFQSFSVTALLGSSPDFANPSEMLASTGSGDQVQLTFTNGNTLLQNGLGNGISLDATLPLGESSLYASLSAGVGAASSLVNQLAEVDLSNTVNFAGFTVLDGNGNIIPDLIITDANGVSYPVADGYVAAGVQPPTDSGSGTAPTSTPEPASLPMIATALIGAAVMRRGAAGFRQPGRG